MDITFKNPYDPQETEEEKKRHMAAEQANRNYFVDNDELAQQKIAERNENIDRYGISVPDYVYEALNKQIAYSEDPEELAHKYGTAFKYSQMFDIPFDEAFENMDNYNAALWGSETEKTYKEWYKAVSDALTMGNNGIRIAKIGHDYMKAEKEGNDDLMEALLNEYEAIKNDNALMEDSVPRNWAVDALKYGAQSLPYTGYTALAGMFGNFINPVAGFTGAWAASTYLTMGQEYMELRDKGIRPEIARRTAVISGSTQGLVESVLGETVSWMGSAAKLAGKKVISKPLQDKLAQTITNAVQKRIHFGPAGTIITKEIARYLMDLPEEGLEEAIQSWTSTGNYNAAAKKENELRQGERTAEQEALDLDLAAGNITEAVFNEAMQEIENDPNFQDLDIESIKERFQQAKEDFKGGVQGALALGLFSFAGNSVASARDYTRVRQMAKNYESPEALKKDLKETTIQTKNGETSLYDAVLDGYEDWEKDGLIHDAFDYVQNEQKAQQERQAKQLTEIQDAQENYEVFNTDEETGITERPDVFYTKEGSLYTQDKLVSEEDGIQTKQFVAGDGSKADNNMYGHIDYTVDERNKKIEIQAFKMNSERESVRYDMYEQFARQHPGYEIDYITTGKAGEDVKNRLIKMNPSGEKNGLRYYSGQEDLKSIQERKKFAEVINKNLPNIKASGQTAAVVALFESLAKDKLFNTTLENLINENFGGMENVFGSQEEFVQRVTADNEKKPAAERVDPTKKVGGFAWRKLEGEMKAVIYAGKESDFSTIVHELSHFYQDMLAGDPELQMQAETAFNVQNGDWMHSYIEGKDGKTYSSAEAFAYGAQDYFRNGALEDKGLEGLFKKFAEFVVRCINAFREHINLNKKITDVYDQMLKNDESILYAASIAAKEADRQDADYRKQQEAENAQRQQQEEKKQRETAADEKEEMAEIWDQVNAENPISEEEIDMLLDEGPEDDFDKRYKEAYDNEPYNREAVAAVELEKAFPEIFNKDLSNAELNNNFVVHMSSEIYDITAHSGFTAITSDKLPDTYHVSYAGVVDDLKQYIKEYDIPMGLTPQNEYRDEYYKYRDGFYAYSFKREKVRQLQQIEANNKELNDAILDAADDSDDPIIELFADDEKWPYIDDVEDIEKELKKDDDTEKTPLCTPLIIQQAEEYLEDETLFSKEESSRIKKNLSAYRDTSWAKLVYLAITGRHDMRELLNGREIPENSLFNTKSKKGKLICSRYIDICKKGEESVYDYFFRKSSLIGKPAKPLYAVAGSFINCNPSLECAQWCYAVEGRSGMAMMILNRELVTWCVENNPTRAADMVAWHWRQNELSVGSAGQMPIRLLDTGDMSQSWLQFIERLNSNEGYIYGPDYKEAAKGRKLSAIQEQKNRVNIARKTPIMCSIFSKRGELLSQVDPVKNIIQLSVDKSNLDLAFRYPELPLSVVFDGSKEMIAFIASQKDRFEQNKGVILPVVINKKYLTEEEIRTLPAWALKYVCPVNAGWRFIGEFSCAHCYLNGQGCNQGRNQGMMQRIIMAEKAKNYKGVIRNVRTEINDSVAEEFRLVGISDQIIYQMFDVLARTNRAIVDITNTGGTEASLRGDRVENQSNDGLGSSPSKHDRLDRFQVIGELGATELDRFYEVTERMDNKKSAEEMDAAGFPPKFIRLATGWEKGIDGLWRYEISDFKLKENPTWTKMNMPGSESYHFGLLQEIIDAPELFKAYSQFKNILVSDQLESVTALGYYDEIFRQITLNSKFTKDGKLTESARSTLVHEVQHAIQQKEGFAKGGNVEQFPTKSMDERIEIRNRLEEANKKIGELKQTITRDLDLDNWVKESMAKVVEGFDENDEEYTIDDHFAALEKYMSQHPDYNEYIETKKLALELSDQHWKSTKTDVSKYFFENQLNNYYDFLDSLDPATQSIIAQFYTAKENKDWGKADAIDMSMTKEQHKNFLKYDDMKTAWEKVDKEGIWIDPHEAYLRIAGEVEARNVQARMDMSMSDRMNRILENTEDISRRDQILLFQAAEMASEAEVERLNDQYMEAVKKNDMETASRLFEQYADRKIGNFLRLQDDADEVGWKWHRGPAPKNIITMYAVFNVSEDGMRAAYAGNKNPTPVGLWIDAQNLQGYTSDLKTFDDGSWKEYIPGDTGTAASELFSREKLEEYGLKPSTKMLLRRGGKHGADVPNFAQMNTGKDEDGNTVSNKSRDGSLPHNKLIFEVEVGMSEDGDLTEYVKENGRFDTKGNEGLAEISPLQFYFYKTNPNANGQWGIAGTFRIKRLVPYDEIVDQTAAANARIAMENAAIEQRNVGKKKKEQEKLIPHFDVQKWQGGYHPEDCGLTVGKVDMMYEEAVKAKLMDPVTYDDNGNVIPLQDRLDSRIADIRFQDDETYELRKQYENTDQWMKAPNGKPTNLNEKQWLQVRTTAFKKWFGDWQNDSENASKVIDENGEPKVVYHGSRHAGFTVFDDTKGGKQSDAPEGTTYFSSSPSVAYTYSGSYADPEYDADPEEGYDYFPSGMYGVFLNIRDPWYEDFEGANWDGTADGKYQIWDLTNTDQWEEPVYNKNGGILFDSREEAEKYAAELGIEKYELQEDPWREDINSIVRQARDGWYDSSIDGVIALNIDDAGSYGYGGDIATDYIVFDPNNIKSATDNIGSYSTSNDDIRYQDKQIYTDEFKRWFGDWENDKSNASKVVDENGKPKIVYHGTRSKERFYVFNTQDLEYRDNIGSHFGPLETAQEFSDTNLYAVYLNIKKPFMPNFDFFADQLNNAYLSVLLQMNNEAETEEAKKAFKEIYEIYPNLSDYNLENMDDDEILDNFDNDEELEDKSLSKEEYRKAHQAHRDAMVEIMIKMMEADGYDGMEYENWYEGEDNNKCYVALYPSQIKSATDNNGKFDPSNPDIRFQTTETVNIPIFHFDKDNLKGQELWDAVEKHVELQEQTKQAYRDLFNDPAFMAMHTVDGEAQRYIHRNVNNPEDGYKWQISYFDRYGPWGHFHFDDLDEVFRRGDMQLEPQLVEVTYDDRIRYDRPYYEALDEKDWNKAAAIIQEYAKTKGYEGLIDTEVTDATDILIPPTKRMNRRWYTQADYDAIGRDHSLLFQTEEELYEDARKFDTWENFMDSYTLDFDPDNFDDPEYHSQVPYGADPDWYRNVWNMANNKDPQTGIRQQDLDEFTGDMSPEAMDNEFVTRLKSDPSMLDEFLAGVAYYVSQDLNSEQWNTFDNAEDQQLVQLISDMKDQIDIYLSDQNWRIAINTVRGGNQISGLKRKQLLTEMSDKDKVRDFREIYAKVMENGRYEVDDKDSNRTKLRDRYELNPDRYYDIIAPYETIETMSPERRKQIAREMTTRDIADKLRSGDLALNDDVSTYIKALDAQIKDLKKKQKQAELDVQTTYTVMGNAERKYLLDLNKRLLEAKAAMTRSDRELQRKLDKGLAITEKYARENKHMKGSFDEVFRKMEDYKRGIEITKEIELAMKKQEVSQELKTEINEKQKERNLLQEIKKMRINLVKRVMRRVPFDRIDYENAKTVIAIQRLLEPNLIGGVNRWIGTSSPILRQVISNIITDTQYKEDLLHYLRMNSKASAAYAKFLNRIESLQSLDDYKTWSKSDRQAAIRYLPKENWIQDLNLKKLAREREESIDLDITTVKKERDAIDTDGTVKRDWQGFPEKETYFALQYSDEIRDMVISAIGEEMFTKIVSVPFADWTTTELEDLAVRINEIYTEGRDMLKAKKELQKSKAAAIRNSIERSILDTGITINDDDPLEVREEKARRINEILGLDDTSMTGTLAAKDKGFAAKLNAILHSYNDANVRRVARILDGWHDGVNVMELCYKENDAYVAKTKKINSRVEKLNFMFEENSISLEDLAKEIKVKDRYVDLFGKETPYEMTYTVDELLYIKAAAEDFQVKEDGEEDFYAATSKNAVMYGNMMSSKADIAAKDDLKTSGKLEEYVDLCRQRMETVLKEADRLLLNHPEYRTLMKVIQDDYAMQYDRMNEISIEEFNAPVHRVKAYVPLVRLDSLQPGNSNENQVKEDLLTVNGLGKVGVNKGMTQRRIRMDPFNQAPVEMGLYKTWLNSIERTEHFIAYAPYVRELNRVYKSNDASTTRKYISARYGNNMIRYIDTYINEVANPRANQVRSAGAEILHTLRGKTAPAYLAWKASAIIKQGLTSPWPYMQFISPLEYMAASAKIIASKGELYDAIRAKSVFMKNRVMDPMNDIIDEMAEGGKTKFDRVIGKQAKIGMAGLEWIDWICVAPGWYGCYLKEYTRLNSSIEQQVQAKLDQLREDQMEVDISSGKIKTEDELKKIAERSVRMNIEDQSVKYADDCTRLCQPSSRSVDISPLFKNAGEFAQAYLQFQTSLNVIWQNIRYDIKFNAKNNLAFRTAGTIVGYVCAGIFMNSVMDGYDDDEDKELIKLRQAIFYALTQFTDAVPMVGSELTNMLDKLITGKQQFMSTGTDMTPTLTKIVAALTSVTGGDFTKAAGKFAEAVGMYLGLPVSGTKEILKEAGIGDGDGEIGLNLSSVYGILPDKKD